MEFMLIMYEGQEEVPAGLMPEMGEFAGKLAAQGKMRGGAPLRSSEDGVRVRVEDGSPSVINVRPVSWNVVSRPCQASAGPDQPPGGSFPMARFVPRGPGSSPSVS